MSLKQIKEKITGIQKTSKVTKAMESISAIKMRKSQKEALDARKYTHTVFSIIKRISKITKKNINVIFADSLPKNKKTLIVLITPSRGLVGGLNINIFKKIKEYIHKNSLKKEEVSFLCIGKKGYDYIKKEGFNIIDFLPNPEEKEEKNIAKKVIEKILFLYKNNEFSNILSFYTNFINTSEQESVYKTILPVVHEDISLYIDSILPTKGKFSPETKTEGEDDGNVSSYIYESNIDSVLDSILPYILNISIYHCLLESRASEHSSRMIAMKNATEKSLEIAEKERKRYNKQRQSLITQEISEIISGMKSLK